MIEAIEQVDCLNDNGLHVEIDLHHHPLPDFLIQRKLKWARLQNNRENVPIDHIPSIIRSNPQLRSLIIPLHVQHHGSTYDGNCTRSDVPILPGQNETRNDGHRGSQRFTIPGIELKYELRRVRGVITQKWKSYPSVRRGPPPVSELLPDLNVFGLTNPPEMEWTPELLKRLHAWEDEIKGWFGLNERLGAIAIIINTDQEKFGRVEKYWCTCNDNGY